jgi:hypothetical protein
MTILKTGKENASFGLALFCGYINYFNLAIKYFCFTRERFVSCANPFKKILSILQSKFIYIFQPDNLTYDKKISLHTNRTDNCVVLTHY